MLFVKFYEMDCSWVETSLFNFSQDFRSPIKTVKYFESITKLLCKLKKLENLSDYITITKGIPFCDLLDSQMILSLPKMPTIKNLEIIYLVSKEW